jgi:hypothetical protein
MCPVVACGRYARRVVLDADNARAAVTPATRAGWRKDGRRWLCPLCVAVRDGTGTPHQIRERVADEVAAMGNDDLALLHGAVVAEIRRRGRP